MTNFEERLLVELQGVVQAESTPRKRRRWAGRRIALVSGLALLALAAAITTGVLVLSAGTQAAYAVTQNADGMVMVEIKSLNDASGLQSALQAVGVNAYVQYLPTGESCQQPWFTPDNAAAGPLAIIGGDSNTGDIIFGVSANPPAGDTLVITTQPLPGSRLGDLFIAWARGAVPRCQVENAPTG